MVLCGQQDCVDPLVTTRRPMSDASTTSRLLAVAALLAGACSATVASQEPSRANQAVEDAQQPRTKPLHVVLSFATIVVETEIFARHRADKDCTDTYLPAK